jgi:hypothetical protein
MLGTVNTPVREPTDHACGCKPGATCDGLECLCRPRFFPGQLLTDEDLGRLDHYVVAKNRLHNRYLHGTGVVCGLEVVCNRCDDTVTVRQGFAIGPCGEDIVVCRDTAVDVGELVRGYRTQRAKADCEPYGARPEEDCEAARQRWILAICYDERPSRGVTSLRSPQPSTCGCSCGGCGGNGNANGNGNSHAHRDDACSCHTSRQRAMPAQCEPTQTCEGYRFVLLKEPPRRVVDRPAGLSSGFAGLAPAAGGLADSELGRRVQACLIDVATRMQQLGQAGGSAEALVELCCELKANLRDIIETGNVHDCMLGARLSDIVCPDPADREATQKATQAIQQLLLVAIDLFKSCVCSALLPPCSVGSPDDCIPLATLTVRTADLRVLDICNWSSRRFAVTFPMLGYWLGWLPIWDTLRAAISRLCCAPTRARFEVTADTKVRYRAAEQPGGTTFAATAAGPEEAGAAAEGSTGAGTEAGVSRTRAAPVTELASQYARHTTPLSGLEATLLAALGAKAEDGTDLASDLELENPFAALALTQLAGPALGPVVPEPLTAAFGRLLQAEPADVTVGEAPDERMTRLEETLADLQKKVSSQARTITNLRKQVKER